MINFVFIGWCNEGNHDKIWGCFSRPDGHLFTDHYAFWARRGNALQVKLMDFHKVHKTIDSKVDKGYTQISQARAAEIWPQFQEEIESKIMIEILSGKVK